MQKFLGRNATTSLLIMLVLLTTGLRLWRLPGLPPGLWYDEAYNAMDAVRLLDTGQRHLFFSGNNGREPLFHYLAALSMTALGATPLALRLVSALVGIVTVPLLYRAAVALFADEPDRHWIGLLAATGLSLSFWHLVMSRAGYRAILFPFFVTLTLFLFWRGWRQGRWPYIIAAGTVLGLSQYTYLSARLLPLIFAVFGLLWLAIAPKKNKLDQRDLRTLWLSLIGMAVISAIVFLPLGVYFWQNPQSFSTRTGDVFIIDLIRTENVDFFSHFLSALRIFIDGYDPNWRHGLVGQPAFGPLSLIGFWLGILISLRRIRRPAYLLLLISLIVLWLPAPFSVPAAHALRLSGMLPAFYILSALGLVLPVHWLSQRTFGSPRNILQPTLLILVLLISGGRTAHGYFVRWANEPWVYNLYDGKRADLTRHLIAESRNADILLPIQLYAHPTVRFLLHDSFREADTLPPFNANRSTLLVNDPDEPPDALVWLTRSSNGAGLAYISRPLRPDDLKALPVYNKTKIPNRNQPDQFDNTLIPLMSIEPLYPIFADRTPMFATDLRLGDEVRLTGYEVWPPWLRPGESPMLSLYWQSLTEQPLEQAIFLQLINGRGEPISQIDGLSLSDAFRWRPHQPVPTRHLLWLSPDIEPGTYLVRLGLFDIDTGIRLPVYNATGQANGDQILLGLFYISDSLTDPRQPPQPLQARLGDQIELLGYQATSVERGSSALPVQLYWQATAPVPTDYTIFVQLLDGQNQQVSGWDTQPLNGLYPTSTWSPGEVVIDAFDLPLPPDLAPGRYRLVTGMYDFTTGQRLPAFADDGQPLADGTIILQTIQFAE